MVFPPVWPRRDNRFLGSKVLPQRPTKRTYDGKRLDPISQHFPTVDGGNPGTLRWDKNPCFLNGINYLNWLGGFETNHLEKYVRQIGSLPQVGVIKHVWNHHPVNLFGDFLKPFPKVWFIIQLKPYNWVTRGKKPY